jgi:hypothetical protein
MRYTFPPFKYVVFVFLIIGPFLAPTVYGLLGVFFKGGFSNISNPLLSFILLMLTNILGVFVWWWGALFDGHQGWKITIVPTILAAASYWAVMSTVCRKELILFKSTLIWITSNIVICACISGIVFYINALVFYVSGNEPTILSKLSNKGSTTLMFLTLTVSIIGAVLGAILALMSTSSPNTSFKRDA